MRHGDGPGCVWIEALVEVWGSAANGGFDGWLPQLVALLGIKEHRASKGMTRTEGCSLEEARSVAFMTCFMRVDAVLDVGRIGGSGTRTVTAATCCIETHLT